MFNKIKNVLCDFSVDFQESTLSFNRLDTDIAYEH